MLDNRLKTPSPGLNGPTYGTVPSRILSDYYLGPPPSLAELAARFREEGEEELLETLLTVPLRELVERYFVSDEVKAAVAIGAFDMGDISAPGSAYITALYRFSAFREDTENYGIVRGGMGGITQSLARSAEASGVSIRTDAPVKRISTNGGRATGVELENGEVIEADIVLSNADPKRTYLKLIDEADLDDDFIDEVRSPQDPGGICQVPLRHEGASRFLPTPRLRLQPGALGDDDTQPVDRPMSKRLERCPERTHHRNSHHPASNSVGIRQDSRTRRSPRPLAVGLLSPAAPSRTGHGRSMRQDYGEWLINYVSEYAPNFREAIIDWTLLTPEDIEERIGLTDGNIRHLDMIPQQMMSRRPLPGWSDYRSPIKNLYLCGAGGHPGGEVTGAPGHNAAHIVLEDLGR